jgi:hypothetical protein
MTNMLASIHGDAIMGPALHCVAKCGVGVPSLNYASSWVKGT